FKRQPSGTMAGVSPELVFLFALLTSAACKLLNHSYLGCYVDNTNGSRDMTGLSGLKQLGKFHVQPAAPLVNSDEMTIELCSSICSLGRFSHFGVQSETQCFCGNSFGSQGVAAKDDDCKKKCRGNPQQKCGGINRNSVYSLNYSNFKNLYTVVKNNSLFIKTDGSKTSWPAAAQSDADCLLRCSATADCQAAVFSQRLLACHLLAFAYPPASLTGPDWTLYQRD
ncbi:hypothetical protein BOX15_Mlig032201g2, partial [Macrostomum lignano]